MKPFLLLLSLVLIGTTAFAELPPSAYEKMQREASEVLRLNVLRVDVEATDEAGTEDVTLVAEVLKVGRSKAKIKQGDLITIKYRVVERPKGWAGPGEVPVPEQATETVAFLNPVEGTADYAPAAGAMSFSLF